MEFEDIRDCLASAQSSTSATRDEASEMLVFGRITHNDDTMSALSQMQYVGQFDLIKPKRNKVVAELHANPVTVTFKPKDGAEPDAAEALNGMFKADMVYAEEAIETAQMDMVDCGFGAFRFVTQYENSIDSTSNAQVIRAEPINEANNVLFFDDNAKKKDKSDAMWAGLLTPFTPKGFERFCKQEGIDYDKYKNAGSAAKPNTDHGFFLRNNTKSIDVLEFYAKEKKRKRVLIFEDPLGQRASYFETEIKKAMDELEDGGYIEVGQKYVDKWEVTKHLVSGAGIMKKRKIAGEHIPIVPMFGDWSFVEKREIWRGIYHDAQDQQRMYDTSMSYLMDIFAKGPREKPIFYPEQIQGYEYMYHQTGMDNNYPYMLQNMRDSNQNELPLGPVGYIQNPQVPPATASIIEQMRASIDDVTGGSMNTADMLNSQVTEGQLNAVNASQSMETFLYRNSYQLAMKQAGRIYASMAAELYDVPREVTIMMPDGTEKTEMVNNSVLDMEAGEEVVLNDLTKGRFEVYADTGPSYTSQREEQAAKMAELWKAMPESEEGKLALLSYLSVQDGPGLDVMRNYARKQLVLGGYVEPETEQDQKWLIEAQQAAQNQQPDPNMLLAMAEQQKAQADMAKVQSDQQIKAADLTVKQYNAETQRLKVMNEGKFDQLEAQKLATEITGNELDNVNKLAEAFMPRTVQ